MFPLVVLRNVASGECSVAIAPRIDVKNFANHITNEQEVLTSISSVVYSVNE